MIVGIDHVLNIVSFSEMEQCYLRCMKNRNTKPLQTQVRIYCRIMLSGRIKRGAGS